MKQFFTNVLTMAVLVMSTLTISAQQLPDPSFEDWSGTKFDGAVQLKNWHASNVEQVGMQFNFEHQETGRTGKYCVMVQDQEVGAMGITENAPGYVSLGQPWQYLPSITQVSQATAGTAGSINFTYRPDSMVVWIKRTGSKWSQEDFHLLFYSWSGTAQGTQYKNKNNGCTSYSRTDEESDVRKELDGNECSGVTWGNQIAEGWLRDRKEYTNWTRISVPIFYMNNDKPTKCNVILSASNYPNFRANSGLFTGNSLYADDIELIYSSKIQQLFIGGKEWKGFDPNSTEEQTYSVGHTTDVPEVYAVRGVGSLTNTRGKTVTFPGRRLSGDEITIKYGKVDGEATTITVKSEDGKSTTTYKIKMVQAPSENAMLQSILVNGEQIKNYSPKTGVYNVALPYGTTATPVVTYVKAEEQQTVVVTQPESTTGTATLVVTAADGKTKKTYTLKFSVAQLADNTLEGIKINGTPIADFIPTVTTYKIELPLTTTTMPKVEAISKYPAGAQTIVYTAPDVIDGGQYKISVTTPGNTTAKIYKLNFKMTASSNSKLKDLQMGGYITNFNPDSKTYYVTFPMGTTVQPEVTYVRGDEYQTVEVKLGGVDGTTTITVTAGNGTVTVYKIICSTEKSDVSYLEMIYLDGEPLEGFDRFKYKYNVSLPTGSNTVPVVTYKRGDDLQKVEVSMGGVNASTYIFVTADDGSTSLYDIYFSSTLANVSTLEMITVGGVNIEGFNPNKTEYYVALPQGTTALPEITWTLHDQWQQVSARYGSINGDTKITVRSQAGTQTVYILHFSVATSDNTELKSVSFNGKPFADFTPTQRDYEIELGEGVSQVPTVTFEKGDASQKVVGSIEGTIYTIRVIAESGAQGVYTFRFIIQKSENAFLNMIYLDGEPLEGFRKDKLDYSLVLETAVCPTITVDKDPTQNVVITAPVAIGVARIEVTPETGGKNVYTIKFTSTVLPQLALIMVDGEPVPGFDSEVYKYENIECASSQPKIKYIPMDESQNITLVTGPSSANIYVEAAGERAVYELTFKPVYSEEVALKSITWGEENEVIPGYAEAVTNYELPMPENGVMPVIGFETKSPKQHVVAGQSGQYDYSLTVAAESGATRTYTIHFTTGASSDTELVVTLDGEPVVFDANHECVRDIVIGNDLPELGYESKEGQSVVVAQTSETQQQLVVIAEDGTTETYTINYNVQTDVDNALLKGIRLLIDDEWRTLKGFKEDEFAYNYTLARGTSVVPCIWPVAGKPGQVITVTYGAADGVTNIHVVAKNDEEQDYTITFAVEKSSNDKLKSLTIGGKRFTGDDLDIIIEKPFGETETDEVEYEKGEAEQFIEFVDAPISDTTKIIVTAENGSRRTYLIRYKVAEPKGENKLLTIYYTYENAEGVAIDGELVPRAGKKDSIQLPYGSKSFEVTGYDKSYDEQAVVFYNGGIRRGAKLIVSANRKDAKDVVYTIVPVMPEFDTAGKLKELKFKNKLVPNFRPDIYNYMINVTEEPKAADFTAKDYEGHTVSATFAADYKTKKQATFTVADGETYSVCWFYLDDPNIDFSGNWIPVTMGVGSKPSDKWVTPGDCADKKDFSIGIGSAKFTLTYTTGKEVSKSGENGVTLMTIKGSSLNSSIPGMMTQGSMAVSLATAGGSTSSVTDNGANQGVVFRNTPQRFTMDYCPNFANDISGWFWRVYLSDGSKTVKTQYDGNYNGLNTWSSASKALEYGSLGAIQRVTFTLASTPTTSAGDYTTTSKNYEASVSMQNLRFIYNSELTAVTVNGEATEPSGKTFTYTLKDGEDIVGIPALKFTGKVHDQTQKIEWLNKGEWDNGELKAQVTNYGENSTDMTVYTVVLHRDPMTSLEYEIQVGAEYSTSVSNDTIFYNMPFATKALPDFKIVPDNIHQLFDITKDGNAITVTVTAEDGSTKTDVYVFREVKSSIADVAISLEGIDGEQVALSPAFEANTFEYEVVANQMPNIIVTKPMDDDNYELQGVELGQIVTIKYTAAGATVRSLAADRTTAKTYAIAFTKKTQDTNGMLAKLTRNGESVKNFAAGKLRYEEKVTENIGFEHREGEELDAVVETITDDSVAIAVTGSKGAKEYKIVSPTELSDNVYLGDILVNDKHYDKFKPVLDSYTLESDTAVDVKFILSEPAQKMEISIGNSPKPGSGAPRRAVKPRANTTVFTVKITAENGEMMTYTFTIMPESSSINTLAGISVNGKPLEDFYPEKTNYTYVIESEMPKLTEPDIPSISYILGQESQTVEVYPAAKLGEETSIVVTPEDKFAEREYKILFTSTPSSNADLENLLINGEPVKGFKPNRYNYSAQVLGDEGAEVTFDYMLGDPFQTVIVRDLEDEYQEDGKATKQIVVTAQDGKNQRVYEVEIWRAAKSNNADLADILFDNISMADYADQHQIAGLKFEERIYRYRIPLLRTDPIPDISARLQESEQTIEVNTSVTTEGTVKTIHVTAADGKSNNNYELLFAIEKSAETHLGMIFIKADSLDIFDENVFEYEINLPIGDANIPSVDAVLKEKVQTLEKKVTADGLRTDFTVTAENGLQEKYRVTFHLTYSTVDTLAGIYVGSELIEGFRADSFYYAYTLEEGVRVAPLPIFEAGDDFQKPQRIDTIVSGYRTTYQCKVTAHDEMHTKTYTVVYDLQPSSVDTLRSIHVNVGLGKRPLEGYQADVLNYTFIVPKDATQDPVVEVQLGDPYQDTISTFIDNTYKITVTAESGRARTYIIRFEPERSNDPTLIAIYSGRKPIENFDPEKFDYTVALPYGTTEAPLITYLTKEGQRCEMKEENDTIKLYVTAEDGITTALYTLVFKEGKSPNAQLAAILLDGEPLETFNPDTVEYNILLPYGTETLPTVTAELADPTAEYEREVEDDGATVTFAVTAADEDHFQDYIVHFEIEKCPINWLEDIYVLGKPLEGYDKDSLTYTIEYPVGSDSTLFFNERAVTWTLADPSEQVEVFGDEGTIQILVTAANGSTRQYDIRQIIKLPDNSLLKDLVINGRTINNFDPETLEYTYIIGENDVPPVPEGIAQDSTAEVSVTPAKAEDLRAMIFCTALNGSETVYIINYEISGLDANLEPRSTDVLFKQLPGTRTFAAYSLRQGAKIAIYDDKGQMYFNSDVPACNPNDAVMSVDPSGREVLTDANGDAAYFDVPVSGATFFYLFYKDKTRLQSGKFIVQ